jgi:hypothetical protein
VITFERGQPVFQDPPMTMIQARTTQKVAGKMG